MAGKNQHYIPSFVQRAFGIRPRCKDIWYFQRGESAAQRHIKRTASENHFYSEPQQDGRMTLDDVITKIESDLAVILNGVRGKPVGSVVEPHIAAAIVSHLAYRTAHLRTTVCEGTTRLLDRIEDTFSEQDKFKALMGLDSMSPTANFRATTSEELVKMPEFTQLDLPFENRERLAFILAKEGRFHTSLKQDTNLITAALASMRYQMPSLVRDSHNTALDVSNSSIEFEKPIQSFVWSVEAAPENGAILPDCVVIGVDSKSVAGNHFLIGVDRLCALLLAVSPDKLLLGRRPGFLMPDDFDYNVEAASLSHTFFLASRCDEDTARLHGMIGRKLQPDLVKVVERDFNDVVRDRIGLEATDKPSDVAALEWLPNSDVQFELSLHGYNDELAVSRIQAAVYGLINELDSILPLERLDGITFGADYPGLLRAVDRGWENAPEPETAPEEVGIGVAQVITIRRSDMVKGRIIMSNIVSDALLAEDDKRKVWAKNALAKQVAVVGLMEIIEGRLPGTLLKEPDNGIDGWLYASVDGALECYTASSVASAYSYSDEVGEQLQECLARAVDRMMEIVPKERIVYHNHGDLEKLLKIVRPAIRWVLFVAADYLGHCAFTKANPLSDASTLEDALDRAGLRDWLGVYFEDLERFRLRLGKWETFDEFLAFNIHVERLLLAVWMFAWEGPEGLFVKVPLVQTRRRC